MPLQLHRVQPVAQIAQDIGHRATADSAGIIASLGATSPSTIDHAVEQPREVRPVPLARNGHDIAPARSKSPIGAPLGAGGANEHRGLPRDDHPRDHRHVRIQEGRRDRGSSRSCRASMFGKLTQSPKPWSESDGRVIIRPAGMRTSSQGGRKRHIAVDQRHQAELEDEGGDHRDDRDVQEFQHHRSRIVHRPAVRN